MTGAITTHADVLDALYHVKGRLEARDVDAAFEQLEQVIEALHRRGDDLSAYDGALAESERRYMELVLRLRETASAEGADPSERGGL